MTDDLGTLRPEVRGALDRLVYFLTGTHNHNDFYTIRAELLRLAKAEFELMLALQDRLGVQDEYAVVAKGWQERAEKAEAELAAIKHELVQCDDIAIGDDLPRMVCDVQKARERVAAELAALKARMQWQPIETAPKDGTRILVAVKNGNWSVRTARMSSRMGIGWIVAWDGSYATARCVKPTHWMPLPPPPKGED